MKRMILVFLMLCGVGFGADTTYYVNPDVAPGGSGTSAIDPIDTVNGAIVLAQADADTSHTIYLMAGTYNEDQGTGGIWSLGADDIIFTPYNSNVNLVLSNAAEGIYSRNNATWIFESNGSNILTITTAANRFLYQRFYIDGENQVKFNNCVINHTGTGNFVYGDLNAGGSLRETHFNGCTVTTASASGCLLYDMAEISVKNSSITASAAVHLFSLFGTIPTFKVENNTKLEASNTGLMCKISETTVDSMANFIWRGNTDCKAGKHGVHVKTHLVENVDISGNTFVVTASSGQEIGVGVGYEYSDQTAWAANGSYTVGQLRANEGTGEIGIFECVTAHTDVAGDKEPGTSSIWRQYWKFLTISGNINVSNNNISYTTEDDSHAVFLGYGANNADVYGNFATGGNYQFVIKSESNNVRGNIGIGANPFSIFAGRYNKVVNNTGYATSGNAFVRGNQTAGRATYGNQIYNNIFVQDNSAGFAHSDESNPDITGQTDYVDYNCFFKTTGTGPFALNGVKNTFALYQAEWATVSAMFPDNDENSLYEDPQLDANYVPQNPAVKTGGKPDINGNPTPMGAISVPSTTGKRSIYGTKRSIYGSN